MANVLVNDTSLTAIGNAIREKNGETTLYKPAEMATAIQALATGGGGGELKYLKVQFYNKYLKSFTNENLPKNKCNIICVNWGRTYYNRETTFGISVSLLKPSNTSDYTSDQEITKYDMSNKLSAGQYNYKTQTFNASNQYTTDGYVVLIWVE